ncbi:GAF and ANTAR domain-containing protein [Amycolatopsis magusensis]|uniref:GAF and ANTAR domain-containing protein n=1 Tax=Amycolatopsis magusensis TaxID=882444 RepID=UPI0024A87351|nr:GAF and ANTAR domain-containing protein [Amycolatopsis magusensis]MDI5980686.1 GAF and ANTAR domain-containing protein [Amycolatopsis magusensis]
MDGQRHDRLWRLVAGRASRRTAASGWVGVVCAVTVEQLDVDAAAVTVRTSTPSQDLIAASDTWVESLEEVQYTVGEGPGVTAFSTGEPVLVSDLRAEHTRWPGFADEVTPAGVGAVFAFPLQAGAIRMGTLTLYRRLPGALDVDGLGDAATLAEIVTTALLADNHEDDETALWTREETPGFYDEVNIATGMLAAQLQVSLGDALLRLRAHAFSKHLPLTEVARAVLDRQLRFDSSTD